MQGEAKSCRVDRVRGRWRSPCNVGCRLATDECVPREARTPARKIRCSRQPLTLMTTFFFWGLSLLIIARNFIARADSFGSSSSPPTESASPPWAATATSEPCPLAPRLAFSPALEISFSRSSLNRPPPPPPSVAPEDMGLWAAAPLAAAGAKSLVVLLRPHAWCAVPRAAVAAAAAAAAEALCRVAMPRREMAVVTADRRAMKLFMAMADEREGCARFLLLWCSLPSLSCAAVPGIYLWGTCFPLSTKTRKFS